MAVEEQRLRVRRSLEEKLGVEEASYLMDRPVGGWSDLVTNHTLDLKFRVFDERIDALEAVMAARFALVDERFATLEVRMDERFASVDERFTSLEARIDERFTSLEARIDERFTSLEARSDERLDDRLAALEYKLTAQMDRGFRQQTWAVLTAVIAGMGVMAAIFGGLMLIAVG